MLHTQSLVASQTLAAELEERNIRLVADSNTVLGQLVAAAVPPTDLVKARLDSDMSSSLERFGTDVEATTKTAELDSIKSIYDATMDRTIEDVAGYVNSHFSYVRNTVTPLVKEFAEGIGQFREKYEAIVNDVQYQVLTHCVPLPLLDVSIIEDIKGADEAKESTYKLLQVLPTMSEEDARSYILSGSKRLDKVLLEWSSSLQGEWFSNVYNTYLAGSVSIDPGLVHGRAPNANSVESLSHLLAIYLFAVRRYNDIPDGMNLSGSDYKFQMKMVSDWAASGIRKRLKDASGYNTRGRVILGHDRTGKTIHVFEDTYKDFISKGGSLEAILGAGVSSSRDMFTTGLLENSKELERQWNIHQNAFSQKAVGEYLSNLKSHLRHAFVNLYEECDELESEYLAESNDRKSVIIDRARNVISEITHDMAKDTYELSLVLIALIRFGHTPAYKVLKSMQLASEINPDMDAREAALMAMIDYVSEYIACQITLVR